MVRSFGAAGVGGGTDVEKPAPAEQEHLLQLHRGTWTGRLSEDEHVPRGDVIWVDARSLREQEEHRNHTRQVRMRAMSIRCFCVPQGVAGCVRAPHLPGHDVAGVAVVHARARPGERAPSVRRRGGRQISRCGSGCGSAAGAVVRPRGWWVAVVVRWGEHASCGRARVAACATTRSARCKTACAHGGRAADARRSRPAARRTHATRSRSVRRSVCAGLCGGRRVCVRTLLIVEESGLSSRGVRSYNRGRD